MPCRARNTSRIKKVYSTTSSDSESYIWPLLASPSTSKPKLRVSPLSPWCAPLALASASVEDRRVCCQPTRLGVDADTLTSPHRYCAGLSGERGAVGPAHSMSGGGACAKPGDSTQLHWYRRLGCGSNYCKYTLSNTVKLLYIGAHCKL